MQSLEQVSYSKCCCFKLHLLETLVQAGKRFSVALCYCFSLQFRANDNDGCRIYFFVDSVAAVMYTRACLTLLRCRHR